MKTSVLRGLLFVSILSGIWACAAFGVVWGMPLAVVVGLIADTQIESMGRA